MFAIMHANFQQMTYAFLLGLILGFVVLKTRSLLASIVMHSTLNVISVILCYGPINDFYVAFNQEIITVALVVSPPILVASIILFSLYTKKRNARLGISNDLPSFESIKEKPFEKILAIILFATFVLTNIVDAISAW